MDSLILKGMNLQRYDHTLLTYKNRELVDWRPILGSNSLEKWMFQTLDPPVELVKGPWLITCSFWSNLDDDTIII